SFAEQHQAPIPGRLGEIVGAPGRVIGALHSFNRQVFYAIELNAQAIRAATAEGLEGNAPASRAAALLKDPTQGMMDAAIKFANDNAYMSKPKYGSAMWYAERLANANFA